MTARLDRLRDALEQHFRPEHLEIVDESARHAGHPGAAAGGGHFNVVIVAAGFRGKSLLDRQRAVHAALGSAMQSEIHALSLRTLTPEEWSSRLQ